jgi:hypothetical protein
MVISVRILNGAALAEQILVEVQSGLVRMPRQLERAFDSFLASLQGRRLPTLPMIEEMLSARMLAKCKPDAEDEFSCRECPHFWQIVRT